MLFTIVHSSPGSCTLVLSDLRSKQLKTSTCIQWIRRNLPDEKQMWRQSGSVVSLTTGDRLPNSTFCYIYEWVVHLIDWNRLFGFADLGKTCSWLDRSGYYVISKLIISCITADSRQHLTDSCDCYSEYLIIHFQIVWKYSKFLLAVEMRFLLLGIIFVTPNKVLDITNN